MKEVVASAGPVSGSISLLHRFSGRGPIVEPAAVVLVHVETRRLREFDRPNRSDARAAGKHDPPPPRGRGKRHRIEDRERVRGRAWDVTRRELVRLADIDEQQGTISQAALDRVPIEIDNSASFRHRKTPSAALEPIRAGAAWVPGAARAATGAPGRCRPRRPER